MLVFPDKLVQESVLCLLLLRRPDLVLSRHLELELSGHGAAVLGLGGRLQLPQSAVDSLDEVVQVVQLSVVLEDLAEVLVAVAKA